MGMVFFPFVFVFFFPRKKIYQVHLFLILTWFLNIIVILYFNFNIFNILLCINAKYNEDTNRHRYAKVFKEENRVIMFLCKKRFLMILYSKLWSKKYVLYTIINKINDNVYIINLLNNMGIFIIFNVFYIYLYYNNKFLYSNFFIFKFLYSKFMNKKVDVKHVVNMFTYRPHK
jgi:hypothetical protein